MIIVTALTLEIVLLVCTARKYRWLHGKEVDLIVGRLGQHGGEIEDTDSCIREIQEIVEDCRNECVDTKCEDILADRIPRIMSLAALPLRSKRTASSTTRSLSCKYPLGSVTLYSNNLQSQALAKPS